MLLRIYISDTNVRRVQLLEAPESVDHLKTLLEEKLQLKKGFVLQFEDPDFDNALCNLDSIDDLPAEKAVLKVIWENEPSSSQDVSDGSSMSSLDTASMSSSSGALKSPTSIFPRNLRSVAQWPSLFNIPTFSLDVELRLQKANAIYQETKKSLNVPRDIKSEILDKLAQVIFEIKAYPDAGEIESVASALVQKHPYLTEPGKEEICREFFRITNINLLSTFKASLDKYTAPLLKLYRRRKESFGKEMRALLENLDDQVNDIVAKRQRTVLEGLPLFLRENPSSLLKICVDTDTEDHYTKDVKVAILTVMEDDVAASTSWPNVTNIAIILEEVVVLRDIVDLPTAFAYLFGLLFAINMEYPQELRYTFEAIQKIFMDLGESWTARVHSLKVKLC